MSIVKDGADKEEAALKWLALGIRDSSINLAIKMKPKDGGKKITIGFQ